MASPDDTLVSDELTTAPSARSPEARRTGARLGRYVVLEQLGAGGMGVVYAAYDPELDRKVALKLVLPEASAGASLGRGRLLREAQALARLSHPNVVTVHDVGLLDDQLFVAMEFVEGQTLGQWGAAEPRSLAEQVEVLAAAGEGLAAAHAKGLVHRDFKPDNVMVGADGRVRVMDFGLARAGDASRTPASPSAGPDGTTSSLSVELTAAGAIMGTPAYMAPEQWLGVELDARTDQFAFSVAAWELLYGERPFQGETVHALARAVADNERREPPRSANVPAHVRRALERGLAPIPADRFPGLAELLLALRRDPRRARRRVAAAAALALTLVGSLGWARAAEARRIGACEAEGARVDELWSASRGEELQAGIPALDSPYGRSMWNLLRPRLDRHAEEWKSTQTGLCLGNTRSDAISARLAQRSQQCLDERFDDLESLLELTATADLPTLASAATLAASLPSPTECLDPEHLDELRLPAAEDPRHEAARGLDRRLRRARILRELGQHSAARDELDGLLSDTRDTEWAPLIAEVELELALLASDTGEFTRAAELAERSFYRAGSAGQDRLAVTAAGAAATTYGRDLTDPEGAKRWLAEMKMFAERVEPAPGLLHAQHAQSAASGAIKRREYELALTQLRRAEPLLERELGREHPQMLDLTYNRAASLLGMGSRDEAAREASRLVEQQRAIYGDMHPDVGNTLGLIGAIQWMGQDLESAERTFRQSLEVQELVLGPNHPAVGGTLNNLGAVMRAQKRYEDAAPALRRALAIGEARLGPGHPDLGTTLYNLALIEHALGELDEALEHATRALGAREAQHESSVASAKARWLQAQIMWDLGDEREEALELARQARKVFESHGDREKRRLAQVDEWLTPRVAELAP